MNKVYQAYLKQIPAERYRTLRLSARKVSEHYLDFSTNDYLNLSRHPKLIEASILAARQYGVGATGARLLSGNSPLFESLERMIAKDKKTEAALVFNSGFQANCSVLSALLEPKVLGEKALVFFDKANHASLYQAIFLIRPELVRYRHNDMEHLSLLLAKYQHDPRPKYIVTETVFGMDGDILPIEILASLAKKHRAFIYLDEAHATGLFGENGYGLSTTINWQDLPIVIMGTFSKALGTSGAYIACSQVIKEFLINKAKGFIYSTALAPTVIGATMKAWSLVKRLGKERLQLFALSKILREKLTGAGFNIGLSASHIIPVLLGKEDLVIRAKEILENHKIIVSCIRPPTVPIHSSCLRIALNTHHTQEDIEKLLAVLCRL